MSNTVDKELYNLGSFTTSITPDDGVDLYALDGCVRTSNNLHSNLFANTITITSGEDLLIIVSLDLIWVDKIFTKKVRKWLNEEYSNYETHLFLVATHSHSTPQISTVINNSAIPSLSYLSYLYDQVCKSIKYALDSTEQCYAELSITHPNLTVNRRKKILSVDLLKKGVFKAVIKNRPNYKGLRDDSLYSLWFYDSDGNEKAVLLNYACHPTLFRNNAVSSDFPGFVSNYLKDQLSKDLVVCFLQGFTGNIKANLTKSLCFDYKGILSYIYNCFFDRLQFNKNVSQEIFSNFSIRLAQSAMLRDSLKQIKPQLFFYNKIIDLPLQDNLSYQYANLDISYISIGDKLRMITLGGEVFSEYSLWLRRLPLFEKIDLLTVGYCNDMIGYIPNYSSIKEGGYEVERAFKDFSYSLPFSDEIENIIKKELKNIIKMDFTPYEN